MNKTLLENALGEYGVAEIVGKEHAKRVVQYFADAGHAEVTNDETAWCAAFLNAMLHRTGLPTTGSLMARSFLEIGIPTEEPELGDIVVYWRVAKDDPRGHAGIFIRATEDWVYTLGGNQSNQVTISKYPKYQVLGYRKMSIETLPEKEEPGIV